MMIIYLFDNTIKTEEDIELYVGLKTLGKLPINENKKEIIIKDNVRSYVTESINTIRTNILYMNSVKNARTILVTSCMAQEGKSWTSANIAVSFAETNKKVLLIDADMRKGRANKIFEVGNEEGLSNYLSFMNGNINEDLAIGKKYIKETKIPNLHILTNGSIPPNPSELLNSDNMKELITILKNVYDIIIIDSPPCMLVTDSIILSTIVDSTVLVVNSEKTKIKDLTEVKKSIEVVDGKIIGTILNKIKIKGKIYSKSYYYEHNKPEDKCEIKEKEIISVDKVFEDVSVKLETNEVKEFDNMQKEIKDETIIESNSISKQDEVIKNEKLKKIIDDILGVKLQLRKNENISKIYMEKTQSEINNIIEMINKELKEFRQNNISELENKISNLNYDEKLNKISDEINSMDYSEELIRISNELHKIKNSFEETNYKKEIENKIAEVYEEIKGIKKSHTQLVEIVNDTTYIDYIMDFINKDKLTKEQVKTIVGQEILNIDYSKQFKQIEKMILDLKDNYIELADKLNEKQNSEERIYNESNTTNIIDIEELKKEKKIKKKRKTYSIQEEISYDELLESANCIIQFTKNNSERV